MPLLRWVAALLILLGLLRFRLRSPAAQTVLRAVYGEEAAFAHSR